MTAFPPQPTPTDVSRSLCLMTLDPKLVTAGTVAACADLVRRWGWDAAFSPAEDRAFQDHHSRRPHSAHPLASSVPQWVAQSQGWRRESVGEAVVCWPAAPGAFEALTAGPDAPALTLDWLLAFLVAHGPNPWAVDGVYPGWPLIEACCEAHHWGVVGQLLRLEGAPPLREVFDRFLAETRLGERLEDLVLSPSAWAWVLEADPSFVPTADEAAAGDDVFFAHVRARLPRDEAFAQAVVGAGLEVVQRLSHRSQPAYQRLFAPLHRAAWLRQDDDATLVARAAWMLVHLLASGFNPDLDRYPRVFGDYPALPPHLAVPVFCTPVLGKAAGIAGELTPLAALLLHDMSHSAWCNDGANHPLHPLFPVDLTQILGAAGADPRHWAWAHSASFGDGLPMRGLVALMTLGSLVPAPDPAGEGLGKAEPPADPHGLNLLGLTEFPGLLGALATDPLGATAWADVALEDALVVTRALGAVKIHGDGLAAAWRGVAERYPGWFRSDPRRAWAVVAACAQLPDTHWGVSVGMVARPTGTPHRFPSALAQVLLGAAGLWTEDTVAGFVEAFRRVGPSHQGAMAEVFLWRCWDAQWDHTDDRAIDALGQAFDEGLMTPAALDHVAARVAENRGLATPRQRERLTALFAQARARRLEEALVASTIPPVFSARL